MKIKVTYQFPKMEVSETIEIGNVKNNHLNHKQSKQVDALVSNVLRPALQEKFKKDFQPKIITKTAQ